MKSATVETGTDVGSRLQSLKLILLLTTVLLAGGSPCMVVSSIKTAEARINVARRLSVIPGPKTKTASAPLTVSR
jgi:hypothetical protein